MFVRPCKSICLYAITLSACLLVQPAVAVEFFESFEGGITTGWEAVGVTESIAATDALPVAATDGSYALQITSSANAWDQQIKREGLIADIQQYDTVELDLYVPALDNESGAWSQASLGFVTDTGGFQSMYQYPTGWADLSQGMNHLTWNYGADNIPVGGAWGNFELVTNGSSPNPISPYYIDSFRLSSSVEPEPYKSSWENSDDGWMLLNGFGLTPTDAVGGAPAGAITDGDYALKVDVGNTAQWTQNIELNTTRDDIDAFNAMKANDTVEFDLFVEAGEILPETFTTIGLALNHPGAGGNSGFLTDYATLTFDDTGNSYHFSWKYGDDPNYNPDAAWANFSLITVADAEGADAISEFFIDNFRFSTAAAGIAGDYNGDGMVDAADFSVWRDNEGSSNPLLNDPTGGVVGQAQYDTWAANYGTTSSATTQIPEAGSVALVLAASVAGLLSTGRRLQHRPA